MEKLYYCNIFMLKDFIFFFGLWLFGFIIMWVSNFWVFVIFCLCILIFYKINLKKKNYKFILKYLYYFNLFFNIIKWIFLVEN